MKPNPTKSLFALSILALAWLLDPAPVFASTKVLVLGGSQPYRSTEAAFPATAVATELQAILAADSGVSTPLTVQSTDTYQSDATTGFSSRSLMSWYYWPAKHAANLALLSGTWDYVIMIDDPLVASKFPEYHFEGVMRISEKARQAGAVPISVMTWSSGTTSIDTFGEMAYRVGDGLGVAVAPAGYAWNSVPNQLKENGTRPTANGAYVTAATLYSQIFGRSAKTSTYVPGNLSQAERDTLADTALASTQTEATRSHYSGALRRPTHFASPPCYKRNFEYADFNSSTEDGISGQLGTVIGLARVTRMEYPSGYQSVPSVDHPIDFCQTRFYYSASLTKWQNFCTFDYQDDNGALSMITGVDRVMYPGPRPEQETGAAYVTSSYMDQGEFFIPIRVLWARMQELHPEIVFQSDGHHMDSPVLAGVASMMYTLLSGRCAIGDEPASGSTAWQEWFGRKTGYEIACQHANLKPDVAGLVVLPSATGAYQLTTTGTETMSVKFRYSPKANVTVTATANAPGDVQITPSTLTFTPGNSGITQSLAVKLSTQRPTVGAIVIRFDTQSSDPAFNGLHDEWSYTRPAEAYKWDGGDADNNWSSAANWNPDSAPFAGVSGTLTFDGSTRLNPYNNLANYQASGINFTNTAGAFVLSGSAITLSGNIGFTANPSSAITQTINLDMILNADRTVTTQANGNLAFGGALSGTAKLTCAGPGILTLNGTAAHRNGTLINGGTLRLGADDRLPANGSLTINAASAVLDIAGWNQTLGQLLATNGGNLTLGAGTLTLLPPSGSYYSIYNGAISGSGNLVKDGPATLALTGTTSFTGTTTIRRGKLLLMGPAGSSLNGSRAGTSVEINSGASLLANYASHQFGWSGTLARVTLKDSSAFYSLGQNHFLGDLALNGNSAIVGNPESYLGLSTGSVSYTGTSSTQQSVVFPSIRLANSAGTPVSANFNVNGTNPAGDLVLSGTLFTDGSGITKSGAGTLVLTAANSFGGATNVTNGTLALASGTAIGTNYFVPVAATALNWYTPDDRAPIHAIDGSGQSVAASPSATAGTAPSTKVWLGTTVQTWIAFDLGSIQTVSGFHLWNYNETNLSVRSIANCGIYSGTSLPANSSAYASNGPAWGTLVETMSLNAAPAVATYLGEDYFFAKPVTTRYLQIYVTSNYGDPTYTGISEIGFYTTSSSPQVGSLSPSSPVILSAGATLDLSGLGTSGTYALAGNSSLTASGSGATPGINAAVIRSGSNSTVLLGSRPITLNLTGGLQPDDTSHPALLISQGKLSLNGNLFTVNSPTPLADGRYRLIQVGNGSTGLITSEGAYPPVAGTAVSGKIGSISISNGDVLLTVFDPTYAGWAASWAPGQNFSQDYDHDGVPNGVEYFMGTSGNGFTPSPTLVNGAIAWPMNPAFSGSYSVQTSTDLIQWTDVPHGNLDLSDPNCVRYSVPAGQPKIFIRLKVVPAP